jgi:predicted N-acetyltransferase YhbS
VPGTERLCHDPVALSFALAVTSADLDGAFRLVHDRYVERGYCDPRPDGRRAGAHHALPTTRVFVARDGDEVVGTVTLIQDSTLGLPMAEIYGEELAALGTPRGRVAEISALAVSPALGAAGLAVVMPLVRHVVDHATREACVDRLCIAVHPRHARFYERLRFRRIGALKAYARVNGSPAVALTLDLRAEAGAIRAFLAGDDAKGRGTLLGSGRGLHAPGRARAERRAPALAHAGL